MGKIVRLRPIPFAKDNILIYPFVSNMWGRAGPLRIHRLGPIIRPQNQGQVQPMGVETTWAYVSWFIDGLVVTLIRTRATNP